MIGYVFPGQGSQYAGMGRDFYERYAEARRVFEEASDALGLDVAALCFDAPEEELKLTQNAQPAILTVSVAVLRVLEGLGLPRPSLVAGHSLGEYTALVAARALGLGDAVRIVRERGRYMQEAVPVGEGAMAAVLGFPEGGVEAVCAEAASEGRVVSPANYNAPGQVVISGHADAVQRASRMALERGARKVVPLRVSAPFHCGLMRPAAERLRAVLEEVEISPLEVPVVTNTEARPNDDPARVKELLCEQVSSPVRWDESVRFMVERGVERFIEIGPGNVLTALVRRTVKGARVVSVATVEQAERLANEGFSW